MSPQAAKIGRLALRHEGDSWNAYYALPDTMNDAIPIASIKMAFVAGNEERKDAFMKICSTWKRLIRSNRESAGRGRTGCRSLHEKGRALPPSQSWGGSVFQPTPSR